MSGQFVQVALLVQMDGAFEDPRAFLADIQTAIVEGDESVEIKIAGAEHFVEILSVTEWDPNAIKWESP